MEAVIEIDKGVRWPQPGAELVPCDDVALIFQQDCEELYGETLKEHPYSTFAQLTCPDVQLKKAEPNGVAGYGVAGWSCG
jgi:hypothetical protein